MPPLFGNRVVLWGYERREGRQYLYRLPNKGDLRHDLDVYFHIDGEDYIAYVQRDDDTGGPSFYSFLGGELYCYVYDDEEREWFCFPPPAPADRMWGIG
jgi:hypothetical protein